MGAVPEHFLGSATIFLVDVLRKGQNVKELVLA